MEEKPFRIAVIGGGLCGLSFAISLGKLIPNYASRLAVDIYESTSSLEDQVGAGIGLWAYSWGVLQFLGLDKELAQHTGSILSDDPMPYFSIRKSDEPEGRDIFTLESNAGVLITFHRADVQSVLLRHLPSAFSIHTRKRLRSYITNQHEVSLYFEDGTTASCDLVVGADGLQSNVRRSMVKQLAKRNKSTLRSSVNEGINEERYLQQLSNPCWTGCVVYRDLIPAQKLIDAGWAHHRVLTADLIDVGKNGALMAYPIRRGGLINFAAFKIWPKLEGSIYDDQTVSEVLKKEMLKHSTAAEISSDNYESAPLDNGDEDPWAQNEGGSTTNTSRARWVSRVQVQEVRDAFRGWAPDMQALIDQIEKPTRWAIHETYPLPTYRGNKACIIGDSAHAMLPNVGHGAGQTISDAFVLAKLIAFAMETQPCDLASQLDAILEAYDTIRRPIAQEAVNRSRDNSQHWILLTREDDGHFVDIDLDNDQEVESLRKKMDHNWSLSWDKEAPFKEAERAISLFKRILHLA